MKQKAEEIYHRFVNYEWNDVGEGLKISILEAIETALKEGQKNGNDFIADVSNRRELLLAFADYWNKCNNSLIEETNIDEFLKSK